MNINEKDLMDILLYNVYEDDFYSDMEKNEKLKIIACDYNTDVISLGKRYTWLKEMGINPNVCHLNENHQSIYKIFDEFNIMLNENEIEYYYTSGILSYLLVSKDLERFHHDIDIFVNMKDLYKLEEICNKYNFTFERKIGERSDGTQRIMLKMHHNDIKNIPITVFMYVREKDLSVIQKDYFMDNKRNEFVEYIYNSPLITKLSFSDVPNYHNNIKYYSISLEALFLCKSDNRPKDIYDCSIFSHALDKDKLKQLKDAFKENSSNRVVQADEDLFSEYIFRGLTKKKVLKKYD